MCINLLNGSDGAVWPCRKCWQCRRDRVNDWVGRCVAEGLSSDLALSVTLTYGGDSAESAVLTYPDVQRFLKRLRAAGHAVRYLCAGEYGSKRGRAHWHMVLFFSGKLPEFEYGDRVQWKYWLHGHACIRWAGVKAYKYVVKYILKDEKQTAAHRGLTMSKKPPLGYEYMQDLAAKLVEQRLPLRQPVHSYRSVTDGKGKAKKFVYRGRMQEMLVEEYVAGWRASHGTEPPYSEFLEKMLDKVAAREMREERDRETDAMWRRRRNQWLPKGNKPYAVAYVPETDTLLVKATSGLITGYQEDHVWHARKDDALEAQLVKRGASRSLIEPLLKSPKYRGGGSTALCGVSWRRLAGRQTENSRELTAKNELKNRARRLAG